MFQAAWGNTSSVHVARLHGRMEFTATKLQIPIPAICELDTEKLLTMLTLLLCLGGAGFGQEVMLIPKPVRAPTLLVALLVGVALAFSAASLLKVWFPRLAPLLFIAVSATWLYAGWRVTCIPRHRR